MHPRYPVCQIPKGSFRIFHIWSIINSSLFTDSFPVEPNFLNKFKRISKLLFLAKILEKIVTEQLIAFLNRNELFETFQPGLRANHSTKTALLRVMNEPLVLNPLF